VFKVQSAEIAPPENSNIEMPRHVGKTQCSMHFASHGAHSDAESSGADFVCCTGTCRWHEGHGSRAISGEECSRTANPTFSVEFFIDACGKSLGHALSVRHVHSLLRYGEQFSSL
jgi:hypothetical protein